LKLKRHGFQRRSALQLRHHAPKLPVVVLSFLVFLVLTILYATLPDLSAKYILIILALGTFGNDLTAALPREPWMRGLFLRSFKISSNLKNACPRCRTSRWSLLVWVKVF
jgi:hypothetical protein